MKVFDDKILREWNKIKDYKIFDSINQFAILFDTNPNGSCYKKYSNYPWSKENFFFGEYKDLLNFYKTSTEIPFYLKTMVGKKYGQLELKSFNVKIKNNKRVYYANCICDCGKECEKEYNRIIEGHVTTCGEHKQIHKEDLLTNFKEIVEKYWDYEKNDDLPEFVNVKSDKEYWWKDETGSFKLKPTELTKRKFGTSFHEQCIFFYLKQLFKNVKNRYRVKLDNVMTEADIFIEDYSIAIEYDGVFWHRTKIIDDIEKAKRFNLNSIPLIRVREIGLSEIDLDLTKTIYCNTNDADFHKVIKQIILTIPNLVDLSKDDLLRLSSFKLTQRQFEEDKIKILDQYRTNYVEDNISKTCLIKYWDYDKNHIIPQKVSLQDDVNIWFQCPHGFSKKLNMKLLSKENNFKCNNSNSCLNCQSFYCPLWKKCIENNAWKDYYSYLSVFSNLCPQIKKYFYYKLFIEKNFNTNNNYDSYIGSQLIENNESFYNIEVIYKNNKQQLYSDENLNKKLKEVYPSITLSTKLFKDLNELNEFLNFYNPIIENINYSEFDIDEKHRKFLLEKIDLYQVSPHNWEDYRNIITPDFFTNIKKKVSKYTLELSCKIFTFEELKNIVNKYNPKISKVVFSDFNHSTNERKFLIETLSKIPYFSGIFNDLPYSTMNKWKINQLKTIQKEVGIEEIILTENNIYNYIDVIWKQRKNLGQFGLTFKKSTPNTFIKIDSLEIDFKEEVKQLLNNKTNSKIITPDIENGWQYELCLGGKRNPAFKEFPFIIKNINGSCLIY